MFERPGRVVAVSALSVVALACLTSCSPGQTTAVGTAGVAPAKVAMATPAPRATVPFTVQAKDATGDAVPFGHPLTLIATQGSFQRVSVTDGTSAVQGTIGQDGTTWTSQQPMPPAVTWTWNAASAAGVTTQGSTTAAAATRRVNATANIGSGRVVGVAAPIVVDFGAKVINKAGLQRSFKVMIRPQGSTGAWKPADGTWAWLPDNAPHSTAHFRTRVFWPAHTQVHVILPLADLDWGNGVTGVQNFDWTFTVGRSQIVKADAKAHDIVIYRDGRKVATYPASYGLDSQLNRNTRSGVSIVTDKYQTIEMKSKLFHYDLTEHWAVRINNNGEFIHANPETVQYQGNENVSHGCINLSTANARSYFRTAIYGDPVEVTGTRTKLSVSRTELYDWALSWKQWTAMSAVPVGSAG